MVSERVKRNVQLMLKQAQNIKNPAEQDEETNWGPAGEQIGKGVSRRARNWIQRQMQREREQMGYSNLEGDEAEKARKKLDEKRQGYIQTAQQKAQQGLTNQMQDYTGQMYGQENVSDLNSQDLAQLSTQATPTARGMNPLSTFNNQFASYQGTNAGFQGMPGQFKGMKSFFKNYFNPDGTNNRGPE